MYLDGMFFFSILDKVGSKIVVLKVHLDIMENLHYDNLKHLFRLKKKYNFLVWEDRKLCDIGHTNLMIVEKLLSYQFYPELEKITTMINQSDFKSERLIDYISILPIGGELSLTPLLHLDAGIFLLSQMSSKDNYFNDVITNNIIQLSKKYPNHITGIINQTLNPHIITYPMLSIMPGINLKQEQDTMGQTYRSINQLENKPDIFVVGRAIYNADNPLEVVDKLLLEMK